MMRNTINSLISFEGEDEDLERFLEESLDSLKTLRNYISLILKCQADFIAYYRKPRHLCSKSIFNINYRSKKLDPIKAEAYRESITCVMMH